MKIASEAIQMSRLRLILPTALSMVAFGCSHAVTAGPDACPAAVTETTAAVIVPSSSPSTQRAGTPVTVYVATPYEVDRPASVNPYALPPKHEDNGSRYYSDVGLPYPLPDLGGGAPRASKIATERSESVPVTPPERSFPETSFGAPAGE
jgi:hypothetical protein